VETKANQCADPIWIKTDWMIDLKTNGKVVLIGHKISINQQQQTTNFHHQRWTKYSYGIKNSVKKMAPKKSEGQGNIASEK